MTEAASSRPVEAGGGVLHQTIGDMLKLCRTNRELLTGRRLRALWCILLNWTAGLLEGTAILVLVPVLQRATEQGMELPFWLKILSALGLRDDLNCSLGAFLLLGLASTGISLASKHSLLRLRVAVEHDVRSGISKALLHIRWSMFHFLRLGDIGKSVVVEAVQIAACMQLFMQGVGALLLVLTFLFLELFISVRMTILTLLFATVGGLVFGWVNRHSHGHSDALTDLLSDIGIRVSDMFNHLKFLRGSGLSLQIEQQAQCSYSAYADHFFKSTFDGHLLRFWQEAAGVAFVWLIFSASLGTVQADAVGLLAFLAIFSRLTPRLFALYEYLYQSRSFMNWYWVWKKRFEFARTNALDPGGTATPTYERSMEIRGIGYRFPGGEMEALAGVDISIPQGACVAVVGPSGCGKSTLADILLGLLQPREGRVTLDGADLSGLDLEVWRRRIGLVLQDSPLFHGTVLENIAWGETELDRTRAAEAARLANAWEFIERLPLGLDEPVGEKGTRLSGGQRQRLALARALYRKPWLLVLDEATSALDGENEEVVIRALECIKGSCSMLIMAHQLRTVRMADLIVVLEAGRKVQEGRWDELLAEGQGFFARMATMQGLGESVRSGTGMRCLREG